MKTYESVQKGIDNRFMKAQKALDDIALNSTGSPEDLAMFQQAMTNMAFATVALKEQTRLKASLAKSIIDGIQ